MRIDFRPHANVSRRFARMLARMLEPDVRRRYGSAKRLIRDLERYRARRSRRSRSFVGLAAAAVGLAAISAGALLLAPRTPAEIAAAAGLEEVPSPRATPGPEPVLPAAIPFDVRPLVRQEQRSDLLAFHFEPPLAAARPLDLDVSEGTVWAGPRRHGQSAISQMGRAIRAK
ncbi:MAG: hypothetical protein HYV63_02020 [Candidatus Schekmanbacteria bacterium]|nr:hypothetical protein [Candidatus Schekmanbacteria bacterium]